MASEVSVEGASGLEAPPTDAAAVGLLSGVDEDVSLQVHVLDEAPPTHLAQEAPLLVVEAHVRVERLFLGEAPPTEAASEGLLSAVDLQVRLQVAALVEAPPTDAAAEGLLARVDPQVHLQRGVSAERLTTHLTGVAAVQVRAQVSSQATAGLVQVSADAAAAGGSVQVRVGVAQQRSPLLKRLPADSAAPPLGRPALGSSVLLLRGCAPPSAALRAGVLVLWPGRVHAGVGLQVPAHPELLPADGTAEGLLAGMQARVQLQRQDGAEGPRADAARPAAALVRLQMSPQLIGRVQTFPADAAEPVWGAGAHPSHVLEQEPRTLQSASTHPADEGPRWTPARPSLERRTSPLLPPAWTGGPCVLCPVTVRVSAAASRSSFRTRVAAGNQRLQPRVLGNGLQSV